MTQKRRYRTSDKVLPWTIMLLLPVQYLIGWLMPDLHRDMMPGKAMTFHVAIGIAILGLATTRLIWRLSHPAPPDSSPATWQRVTLASMHWSLYALVFATTLTGLYFASSQGWSTALFDAPPSPMRTAEGLASARVIGRWHESMELALLIVIAMHFVAAMARFGVYRDRLMERILLG